MVRIQTNGQFHICMLVEGDSVEVVTNNNRRYSAMRKHLLFLQLLGISAHLSGKDQAYLVVLYKRTKWSD